MKDYCTHRLLVVGPASDLKRFGCAAEIPGATDVALLERTSTRLAWQFVARAPTLQFLCILSRRWPRLTFILNYDCEDQRIVGLIRARNGRLRHCRFKY